MKALTFFLSILFILLINLLSGCTAARVEMTTRTSTGDTIKTVITAYNTEQINAANKLISNQLILTNPTYKASDVALNLMYTTGMKDRDVKVDVVQINNGRYGYSGYSGSKQETRDMEIDALARYKKFLSRKK